MDTSSCLQLTPPRTQKKLAAVFIPVRRRRGPKYSTLVQAQAVFLVLFALAVCPAAGQDILIADFEGADYGNWKVTGEAFGPGPAHGTLPNQMVVDGFLGHGLVNSFYHGDDSTGTLTSLPFKIERRYLRFLIGGGGWAGETCMNLLVDGKTVRTATGPNTQPGGSEHLDWQQWDVSALAGQDAVIQIVDQRKGGWGHINVDHIVQTDNKLPALLADASREILVQHRYLELPVKNGAPKRLLSLLVDGRVERQFEIELADAEPDWWAFLDLAPFQGKSAFVKVDKLREDSLGLRSINQADTINGATELYHEKLRPQFHFSARRGWNNDPNGLVYYDGEYHLFFQHNPYGWNWGNMHWGHAVSRDLVHWEELPEALYPDRLGTMFSGSAVVDERNTAGFQRGPEQPIVCIYTAAGGSSPESRGQPFTQCIAYSTDRGRSWTKYEHNPVLPHLAGDNRDPKVIWYEPQKKWVMALFLEGSNYALFASTDLKKWEKLCGVTIPGTSECPEFFEIGVAGAGGSTRWIFYGGNGRYLVGAFDGQQFTPESGPHSLNRGNCFYASQTYNHLPAKDGRRILVPWGQVNLPGMPFNQMMGLPVELTLHQTEEGLRLFACPIKELERLRAKTHRFGPGPLRPGQNPLAGLRGDLFELEADLALGQADEVGFTLRGVEVSYEVKTEELSCGDRKAKLKPIDGRIRLRLFLDRASVDIFANEGRVYIPMGVIPGAENRSLSVYAKGGAATLRSLQVHELRPAWSR
jgi:fructan beta-fructosidase